MIKQYICSQCNKNISKWCKSGLCRACSQIGRKHPHSKVSKKKISLGTKKAMKSIKIRKKISDGKLGYKCSKETREKMSISKRGRLHWNWQGKGSLSKLIRSLAEIKVWRTKVFQRDNYTCQECYQYGSKLHSHHKKPFFLILRNFLDNYSQFSPIEDKETLVRLAITWKDFWDIDNGETLCIDCHKLTKSYLRAK